MVLASAILLVRSGGEFQLVNNYGRCLQVTQQTSTFTRCEDVNGRFTDFTVFTITGAPGTYSLHVIGAQGQCIDREHCHSGSSNLRYSDCDHCGAIHWNIVSGKVCEDNCKNCIYTKDGSTAAVKHCSDGYEPLTQSFVGHEAASSHLLMEYKERMHFLELEKYKQKIMNISNQELLWMHTITRELDNYDGVTFLPSVYNYSCHAFFWMYWNLCDIQCIHIMNVLWLIGFET